LILLPFVIFVFLYGGALPLVDNLNIQK
jgi:hypothetical protein